MPTTNFKSFGLMFHYFQCPGHSPAQGALSQAEFGRMVDRLLESDRLVSAHEWMERAVSGDLAGRICLTFDDGLRCQTDVALPVIRSRELTAFWFVPSNAVTGDMRMEAFRRFRNEYFSSVAEFYRAFFNQLYGTDTTREEDWARDMPDGYLGEFDFYTLGDRAFRHARDLILSADAYQALIEDLMTTAGTSVAELLAGQFIDSSLLRNLQADGHIIGLHSHTHPTRLETLSVAEQHAEYGKNLEVLSGVLERPPDCMSHPCNSYTRDTLSILRRLGIRLGFRSNRLKQDASMLELPREDGVHYSFDHETAASQ